MEKFTISNNELVEVIQSCSTDANVEDYINEIKIKCPNTSENMLHKLRERLRKTFLPTFNQKWTAAKRTMDVFRNKNIDWLNKTFTIELGGSEPSSSSSKRVGRPEKAFEDCSSRAKRYKIQHVKENVSEDIIVAAASSINRASDTKEGFSAEKALALMLDADLSKHQYEIIRDAAKAIGHDIYPPYYKILEAKKQCYPSNLTVTEKGAENDLQSLLDHTSTRIVKTLNSEHLEKMDNNITLVYKWGCDGSSGHSEYKQNFSRDGIKDSNLFLTTLVPLRLRNKDNKDLIYWQNSRPSSTRFCRPIRFEFEKESDDVTKTENARMERAIERLVETQIEAGGKVFKVEHVLILTMVDGKVVQTLQNTPGMNTCSHCKATPTQMNKLHTVRNLVIKDEDLPFNIPSLHARIKFMECSLHISYRQTFLKWRIDKENKKVYGAEKIRIQGQLQRKLGIKVDFVKVGIRSFNDGNTAETASITGVSEELIS